MIVVGGGRRVEVEATAIIAGMCSERLIVTSVGTAPPLRCRRHRCLHFQVRRLTSRERPSQPLREKASIAVERETKVPSAHLLRNASKGGSRGQSTSATADLEMASRRPLRWSSAHIAPAFKVTAHHFSGVGRQNATVQPRGRRNLSLTGRRVPCRSRVHMATAIEATVRRVPGVGG